MSGVHRYLSVRRLDDIDHNNVTHEHVRAQTPHCGKPQQTRKGESEETR